MSKFRWLVCVGLTLIFLILQIVLLRNFELLTVSDTSLYDNIAYLHNVCTTYSLECVLVDTKILGSFVKKELAHRSNHFHDHQRCELFCNAHYNGVVFMINGDKIIKVLRDFLSDFRRSEFFVSIESRVDVRELTLERRHVKEKLPFHVFLTRNHALIHIVLTYKILNHDWSNTCEMNDPHIVSKSFCEKQNLYKNLEITHATIDGLNIHVPQYVSNFLDNMPNMQFKACNFAQARTYYSMYGYDADPESELFRQKAKKLLRLVSVVLEESKIAFWLSSGTCLGYYRQCDFIPHSKDVDIGIYIKDYKPRLISSLRHAGFVLKHQFGKVSDSFELSFLFEDLKLDIFFFYEEFDHMWNGGTQVRTGKKYKYMFKKFTLCWTRFFDILVRVPCQIEDYILANYGESWNRPVKTWDWKASPPNVRENGEWPPEERLDVIQTFL